MKNNLSRDVELQHVEKIPYHIDGSLAYRLVPRNRNLLLRDVSAKWSVYEKV